MATTKIATCCYCGTRAALVLKGEDRHELACSSCGAPLHELKMLRQERAPDSKSSKYSGRSGRKTKSKKKKKNKMFRDFILDEVWDTIEDIFD